MLNLVIAVLPLFVLVVVAAMTMRWMSRELDKVKHFDLVEFEATIAKIFHFRVKAEKRG